MAPFPFIPLYPPRSRASPTWRRLASPGVAWRRLASSWRRLGVVLASSWRRLGVVLASGQLVQPVEQQAVQPGHQVDDLGVARTLRIPVAAPAHARLAARVQ